MFKNLCLGHTNLYRNSNAKRVAIRAGKCCIVNKIKEVCTMAELKCKAEHCIYNKDHYCSKGDIMVGGKNAVTSEETRCESFAQKRGDSMTSSTCHPSRTISIDCEVARCIYNANYKCTAEHVDISGSNADTSKETSCSTFKET